MSDLESHVRHSLEALRAQADLSYEELTKDWPRAPDERRASRNAGIPARGRRRP